MYIGHQLIFFWCICILLSIIECGQVHKRDVHHRIVLKSRQPRNHHKPMYHHYHSDEDDESREQRPHHHYHHYKNKLPSTNFENESKEQNYYSTENTFDDFPYHKPSYHNRPQDSRPQHSYRHEWIPSMAIDKDHHRTITYRKKHPKFNRPHHMELTTNYPQFPSFYTHDTTQQYKRSNYHPKSSDTTPDPIRIVEPDVETYHVENVQNTDEITNSYQVHEEVKDHIVVADKPFLTTTTTVKPVVESNFKKTRRGRTRHRGN